MGQLDGTSETLISLSVVILQTDLQLDGLDELSWLFGGTIEDGLDCCLQCVDIKLASHRIKLTRTEVIWNRHSIDRSVDTEIFFTSLDYGYKEFVLQKAYGIPPDLEKKDTNRLIIGEPTTGRSSNGRLETILLVLSPEDLVTPFAFLESGGDPHEQTHRATPYFLQLQSRYNIS
jgi:hypothetical protein